MERGREEQQTNDTSRRLEELEKSPKNPFIEKMTKEDAPDEERASDEEQQRKDALTERD